MDATAKKTLAAAPLVFLLIAALPLMTGVHGQGMTTDQLQVEVERIDKAGRDMQDKLITLHETASLIVAQQQVESQWHREEQEFQGKIIWGLFGVAGAVFLALFGWMLSQFGVVIGAKRGNKA